MLKLRIIAGAGAVALALAITACGGDDPSIDEIVSDIGTDTTTSTPSGGGAALSKDDVISRADSTCAEAGAAISSLPEGGDPAAAADQVRAITEGMRSDIRSLNAPRSGRGDYNDLLAALDDQIAALGDRASTSRSGDDVAYNTAGIELAAAREAARLAGEAYGFEVCGQAFGAVAPSDDDSSSGGVGATTTPPPATTTPPPSSSGGGIAPGGDGGGDDGGGGDSGSGGSGGVSPG